MTTSSPPVSPAASWTTSGSEDVTSPVVFEDLESEIDEEYWRKPTSHSVFFAYKIIRFLSSKEIRQIGGFGLHFGLTVFNLTSFIRTRFLVASGENPEKFPKISNTFKEIPWNPLITLEILENP